MAKYIDIHAHTNFVIFDKDRGEVIRRAIENDTWIINIGTQYDTSKKAVDMTNEYTEGVYACIGLHPIHTSRSYHDENELGIEGREFTSRGEIFNREKYKELAKDKKVVGIGECGLDYYHMSLDGVEKQKSAFIEQIELANELNLPLMLHIRNSATDKSHNAYFDVYKLLKKYAKVKGVVHFFSGSIEDMQRFIEIGFYVSFSGPITFPSKPEICDYEQVIKKTPIDRIMADTDSPYVAPVPNRGKRNEPVHVREIIKKIALIKDLPEEEVLNSVRSNIKKLFDI